MPRKLVHYVRPKSRRFERVREWSLYMSMCQITDRTGICIIRFARAVLIALVTAMPIIASVLSFVSSNWVCICEASIWMAVDHLCTDGP